MLYKIHFAGKPILFNILINLNIYLNIRELMKLKTIKCNSLYKFLSIFLYYQ